MKSKNVNFKFKNSFVQKLFVFKVSDFKRILQVTRTY